ncbi:MAG: hypothetical protein WCA46_27435 [Actinocatenispora sp.]
MLWTVWGVALGAATFAYHLRRRGECRWCGRGGVARGDGWPGMGSVSPARGRETTTVVRHG